MINATIMHFDALLGQGQVITDAGQILTLDHRAITGAEGCTLPSERDWRWLDRIAGLRCRLGINSGNYGNNQIVKCVIQNAPRIA